MSIYRDALDPVKQAGVAADVFAKVYGQWQFGGINMEVVKSWGRTGGTKRVRKTRNLLPQKRRTTRRPIRRGTKRKRPEDHTALRDRMREYFRAYLKKRRGVSRSSRVRRWRERRTRRGGWRF